eukprot:7216968-Prymnesium_polylepis.2
MPVSSYSINVPSKPPMLRLAWIVASLGGRAQRKWSDPIISCTEATPKSKKRKPNNRLTVPNFGMPARMDETKLDMPGMRLSARSGRIARTTRTTEAWLVAGNKTGSLSQ